VDLIEEGNNLKAVVQSYTGTSEEWKDANPRVYEGVLCIELLTTIDGNPVYDGNGKRRYLIKIGDGISAWNDLPYLEPENIKDLTERLDDVLATAQQLVSEEQMRAEDAEAGLQVNVEALQGNLEAETDRAQGAEIDLNQNKLDKQKTYNASYDAFIHAASGAGMENYDGETNILVSDKAVRAGGSGAVHKITAVTDKNTLTGARGIFARLADGVVRLFYTRNKSAPDVSIDDEVATRGYVAEFVAANVGIYLGNAATKEDLEALNISGYPPGHELVSNDWAYVLEDETQDDEKWSYIYNGTSWAAGSRVNDEIAEPDNVGLEKNSTGYLQLKDGGVTDSKIGNRAVTDTGSSTLVTPGAKTLTAWFQGIFGNLKYLFGLFDPDDGHIHDGGDSPRISFDDLADAPSPDDTGIEKNASDEYQLKDGGVTDSKIGDRAVTDTESSTLVAPGAKALTAWFQGLYGNVKYLFSQNSPLQVSQNMTLPVITRDTTALISESVTAVTLSGGSYKTCELKIYNGGNSKVQLLDGDYTITVEKGDTVSLRWNGSEWRVKTDFHVGDEYTQYPFKDSPVERRFEGNWELWSYRAILYGISQYPPTEGFINDWKQKRHDIWSLNTDGTVATLGTKKYTKPEDYAVIRRQDAGQELTDTDLAEGAQIAAGPYAGMYVWQAICPAGLFWSVEDSDPSYTGGGKRPTFISGGAARDQIRTFYGNTGVAFSAPLTGDPTGIFTLEYEGNGYLATNGGHTYDIIVDASRVVPTGLDNAPTNLSKRLWRRVS
jgi:hypothetical protein